MIKSVAIKYGISQQQVDKILIKLEGYNNIKGMNEKYVEDMTWKEFQQRMKKYGKPWPKN